MQISKHFNLDELVHSDYGVRHDIDNTPPPSVRAALVKLTNNILEPLRVKAGRPVIVSSAYRCGLINRGVGGSETSQHCDGEAADLNILRVAPYTTAQMIVQMGLPFDQLILEFGRWVHVSHAASGKQRGQILTATKINGQTRYLSGLHR